MCISVISLGIAGGSKSNCGSASFRLAYFSIFAAAYIRSHKESTEGNFRGFP